MKRFTVPRDTYFGKGALSYLKEVKGTKAIIVIGSERLIKDGTVPKAKAYLEEAGIEVEYFTGVEPDPSIETVMRGAEAMQRFQPDVIVSIGGGSPIDAAKAMWIFYEYPNLTFDDITTPFSLPELRQKAKFYAVPTTSGTATEVTAFSVITDYSTGIKYPLADYNITPDVAILDTDLVETMPKMLVAHTGMDALTHAIEAYASVARNPITDTLGLKAIEMIGESLTDSYNGKVEARENMHIAQSLAGMSFSNALLGIVHSMAHKTGKIFDIPHGLANAIYLPYAIEYNAKAGTKPYADIAKALKVEGATEEELVENLVTYLKDLRSSLEIVNSLKEMGIEEEVFLNKVDKLAETAYSDPCTGANPRTTSVEDMKKIFTAIYYGEKIDF